MASKRDYRDDLWWLISFLAFLMAGAVRLASWTARWWLAVWIMVVATVLFCAVLACCWAFAQMCWLDNKRRLRAQSQDDPDPLLEAGHLTDGPAALEAHRVARAVGGWGVRHQVGKRGQRQARESPDRVKDVVDDLDARSADAGPVCGSQDATGGSALKAAMAIVVQRLVMNARAPGRRGGSVWGP
jgi:hypothetical protein